MSYFDAIAPYSTSDIGFSIAKPLRKIYLCEDFGESVLILHLSFFAVDKPV
ncbi:hypothetical protein NIES2107_27270 [Nostoc carneum NIES-2107]|nr:hypothetical protein NIES2107_27270 [Nostoc carneum NIES-2107]